MLNKRYPGFAEDLDQLNAVIDRMLLGDYDAVLRETIGQGDPNFNAESLSEEDRKYEFNRLLKMQITRLAI